MEKEMTVEKALWQKIVDMENQGLTDTEEFKNGVKQWEQLKDEEWKHWRNGFLTALVCTGLGIVLASLLKE